MNEFDLLGAAINAAIKHARHNQKAHGRRGGVSASISPEQAAVLSSDIRDVPKIPFKDKPEAIAKHRILFSSMGSEMSNSEQSAFRYYTVNGFTDINEFLSGKRPYPDSYSKGAIPYIDDVMRRTRVPADTVVYRGMNVDDARLAELTKPGAVIERGAYTSTSASISVATRFHSMWENKDDKPNSVVMHVKVPAGSNAVYVDRVMMKNDLPGDFPSLEYELLLPRGSKMIVRESYEGTVVSDGKKRKVTHVVVELLPWEEKPIESWGDE